MLKIDNLSYGYNGQVVIDELSFEINYGDYVAIIGSNGSGKSTLVKCLIGINKVSHNQITYDGECISCFKHFEQIGYVAQINNKVFELPISAKEYLKLICNDTEKINRITKLLKANDILNQNMNQLSGGQKQRINIAKSLLNDVKYLILDEPSTGLDVKTRESLYKTLKGLNNSGLTIIIVSHHLLEVSSDVNKVLDLENYVSK